MANYFEDSEFVSVLVHRTTYVQLAQGDLNVRSTFDVYTRVFARFETLTEIRNLYRRLGWNWADRKCLASSSRTLC